MEVKIEISKEAVDELINGNLSQMPQEDFRIMMTGVVDKYMENDYRRAEIIRSFINSNPSIQDYLLSQIKIATCEVTSEDVMEVVKEKAQNYVKDITLEKLLFQKEYSNEYTITPAFNEMLNEIVGSDTLKLAIETRAKRLVAEINDPEMNWGSIVEGVITDLLKEQITNNSNMHRAIQNQIHQLVQHTKCPIRW